MEEELEQKEEIEQPEQPERKRQRLRSPRAQCQQVIDELSDLAQSANVKPNNRTDALLRKSELLVELMKISAKEKESDALIENETLKQQHVEDSAKIAELQTRVDSLAASQHPVEIREIPDSRLPETIALNQRQADLLQNAAQAVRENVEEPTRLKIAAVLVKKMGKGAQPLVSDIADWASVYRASMETDDALIAVIDAAQPGSRGAAVQVAKATLSARGISYAGPQVGQPKHFADEFA